MAESRSRVEFGCPYVTTGRMHMVNVGHRQMSGVRMRTERGGGRAGQDGLTPAWKQHFQAGGDGIGVLYSVGPITLLSSGSGRVVVVVILSVVVAVWGGKGWRERPAVTARTLLVTPGQLGPLLSSLPRPRPPAGAGGAPLAPHTQAHARGTRGLGRAPW